MSQLGREVASESTSTVDNQIDLNRVEIEGYQVKYLLQYMNMNIYIQSVKTDAALIVYLLWLVHRRQG